MARCIGKIWTEYHNGKRLRYNLFIWDDGKTDPTINGTMTDSYEQLRRLIDV